MKELTVVLTDRQAERLAEEERRHGVPAVVQIGRALDAYLGIKRDQSPQAEGEWSDRPADHSERASNRLWFVGLGRSGRGDIAANMEQILADELDDWMVEGAGLSPRRSNVRRDENTPARNQSDGDTS